MEIYNIIGLGLGLLFSGLFFVLWLRAEYKLAKHNESNIFKEKNND